MYSNRWPQKKNNFSQTTVKLIHGKLIQYLATKKNPMHFENFVIKRTEECFQKISQRPIYTSAWILNVHFRFDVLKACNRCQKIQAKIERCAR